MTDQPADADKPGSPDQPAPEKTQDPGDRAAPNSDDLDGTPQVPPKRQKDGPGGQQKQKSDSDHRSPNILISPEQYDIIAACLFVSFSNQSELADFCLKYFIAYSKNIRESADFDGTISGLIRHCGKYGIIDELWGSIKRERPNHYKSYYPKWEQVTENLREAETIAQFKSGTVTRESPPRSYAEWEAHPLSGKDPAAISDWFHNELGPEEKGMVLTVALFEGINRRLMVPISQEIERRLLAKPENIPVGLK